MFPANILVRYIQPQRMIGIAMILFGILILCLSAAESYGAVLAIRILVGCFQSSVQVIGTYTPYWYQRNEVATRAGECNLICGVCFFFLAILFQDSFCARKIKLSSPPIDSNLAAYYSAATISGAFSGLMAYGVQINLDGVGGRKNWQWLFIIEGTLAVCVGIIFWLLFPPYPDQITSAKHWLFRPEEIALAQDRAGCISFRYQLLARGC
jgi:sugar phosphate permease